VSGHLVRFPWRGQILEPGEARSAAERVLATPPSDRVSETALLHLEDPEQLLSLCEILHERLEETPAVVTREAAFFHGFLDSPKRPIGSFDEREYYLGEFALLAGAASRILGDRVEARRWLQRAEANFVLVANSSTHIARLAYQRLALRLEERQFEEVLEFAQVWCDNFASLGLRDDALKCRFLEAIALKETERFDEASRIFTEIIKNAQTIHNDRLGAIASQNLFQIYAFLGDTAKAVSAAQETIPALRRLNNRVGLAKLQLGLGYLLRSHGSLAPAIEAYRAAQQEFREIGMRADISATHLVLADLLLDVGQGAQAEWEIRAALPVIDELQLVPEGIAALTLLRESLRRRQIDRQALRSLNGYFEELRS
jgi:tetratricopeptide (TPR) repeat protein